MIIAFKKWSSKKQVIVFLPKLFQIIKEQLLLILLRRPNWEAKFIQDKGQ